MEDQSVYVLGKESVFIVCV